MRESQEATNQPRVCLYQRAVDSQAKQGGYQS